MNRLGLTGFGVVSQNLYAQHKTKLKSRTPITPCQREREKGEPLFPNKMKDLTYSTEDEVASRSGRANLNTKQHFVRDVLVDNRGLIFGFCELVDNVKMF